jgi:hypothetical protein
MPLRIICLCFLVSLLSLSQAKAQQYIKGEFDAKVKRPISKVIGVYSGYTFSVRTSNYFNAKSAQIRIKESQYELTCNDENLQTIWNISVDLSKYFDPLTEQIFLVNDSVILFFSCLNKTNNTLELYKQTFFFKNGYSSGACQLLDEQVYDRKRSRGEFFITHSRSTKFIVVLHRLLPEGQTEFYHKSIDESQNSKEQISIKVFDSNFKLSWQVKTNNVAYEGRQIVRDLVVDVDSRVYLLTGYKASMSTPYQLFKVLQFEPGEAYPSVYQMGKEGTTFSDIKISIDNINGWIVFGGFYSENATFSSTGVAYSGLQPDEKKISELRFSPFKAKEISNFGSTKGYNRPAELINYEVDRLVLRSDGGMVLVAESNYITESSSYNSYYQVYTVNYTYYYGNVMIISVNPDGSTDWIGTLRKNQVSENDEAFYSSYSLIAEADKIILLYNETIRRRSDVKMYVIDNNGNVNEKVAIPGVEEIMLMPRGAKQISANQIVIPCSQNGKPIFVKYSY